MAESLALTCQYEPCGKAFEAPRRRKYCEPLCERRAYSKKRLADGRHKAYRERAKDQRASYMVTNRDRYKVQRECLACGATWKTQRKDAKYCSNACRDLMRPGVKESPVPETHPARRGMTCEVPPRHPARCIDHRPRRWIAGLCRRCAAPYVVADNRRPAAYCSHSCLRRMLKRLDARECVTHTWPTCLQPWCTHGTAGPAACVVALWRVTRWFRIRLRLWSTM